MNTNATSKDLLNRLRTTPHLNARMNLLQSLSNEEQFELDKYLCYGERTVEGTVCFPYKNGKFFNQKPTEKAPWIPNRYINLPNLLIEPVKRHDNYRSLNILKPESTERYIANINYINELYIDIDSTHKDSIPKLEQIRLLKLLYAYLLEAFDTGACPRPTSFLFSGRGFALHYILSEPIQVNSEDAISFAALYQCAFDKLEQLFNDNISEAGADVDRSVYDLSRTGRVAGTWNSKAKCFSRFIDITGHYFSLDELISAFVEDRNDFEIRKERKKSREGITKAAMTKYYASLDSKALKQPHSEKTIAKIKKARTTKHHYTISFNSLLEQDLPKWCHIASFGIYRLNKFFPSRKWVDGSGRYNFGLIYYNFARTLFKRDQAEFMMRDIISKMDEPLNENTIERIITDTENLILNQGHPLRYSFDVVCETLHIDSATAEKYGIVSKITRAKKSKEHISLAADRDKEIMRLYGEGLSERQINNTLKSMHPNWHISNTTVHRTINKFKDYMVEIDNLERTTYISYGNTNIHSYSKDNILLQHFLNVVKKDSKETALVNGTENIETVTTELRSENSISESQDNKFKEHILEILKNGENVFLHGMGGTGKTYLINQFLTFCRQENRNVAVVAPTGVAACNFPSAATIHSFFRLSPGVVDESSVNNIQIQVLKTVDVLIIDEMSMVRCDLFDVILYIVQNAEQKYNRRIQLVLSGDVGQLPCVATEEEQTWLVHNYHSLYYMFFKAKRYTSLPLKHVLFEKNRRTKPDEKLYSMILKHVHDGDSRVLPSLNERVVSEHLVPPSDIIALAARRNTVNKINETVINEHLSDPSFQYITASGTSDTFENEFPVPIQLPVFEGMKIMFIINRPKKGYVNGTMGKILKIQKSNIKVLVNGKQLSVKQEEFISALENSRSIKQFPFVPAYAITIHKSQGLSLDQALIFPDCFAPGMLYTALSRLRSLDGLYLAIPIQNKYLIMNSESKEYMEHLDLLTAETLESPRGM